MSCSFYHRTKMFLTVLVTVVLLVLLSILLEYLFPRHLLLNDVTTSPDNPPQFRVIQNLPENRTRNMNFVQKAYDFNKKYYAYLQPLSLQKSPSESYTAALQVAKQMPHWKIVNEDERDLRIEAVAKTPIFGFRDDIIIEIRPITQKSSAIHVRSKSRSGLGDLGINAKRIVIYLAAFNQ